MDEEHSAGKGSYHVLARRTRPQTFAELIGQPHIAKALSNAITSTRIGHAYLFTGARGVGKTSTARIYAKALNCATGTTLTPCGECDSCKSISTGEDIDVLEIDAASNRGIEEIRQLRQNASIRPSRSRFKIYILDEVHMLTKEAFNALLKILEEPPEHIKFIFCTTEPSKIPITILSRCQRFDFAGIETKQIADHLAAIAENEKVTAEDGVYATLARRAAGSMRDALSLLEQLLSFAPEHISLNDVHEMLGTANDQLLFRLLSAILDGEQKIIFDELESAAAQGVDFGVLAEQMLGLYRDLLAAASGGTAELLLHCSPQQFNEVKEHADKLGLHRILASMQILDHTYTRMQRSTQGRILMELALVRIANLDHFHQVAVLLEQLRSGNPAILPAASAAPSTVKSVQKAIAPPNDAAQNSPHQAMQRNTPAGLADMTDDKAFAIWAEAADLIPGMLGSAAGKCISLRFEKPNVFIAVFDKNIPKDLCARESARLQGMLSQLVGEAVKIRLELTKPPENTSPANTSPNHAQPEHTAAKPTGRERYLAVLEIPVVQAIQDSFGVTLSDIR